MSLDDAAHSPARITTALIAVFNSNANHYTWHREIHKTPNCGGLASCPHELCPEFSAIWPWRSVARGGLPQVLAPVFLQVDHVLFFDLDWRGFPGFFARFGTILLMME